MVIMLVMTAGVSEDGDDDGYHWEDGDSDGYERWR